MSEPWNLDFKEDLLVKGLNDIYFNTKHLEFKQQLEKKYPEILKEKLHLVNTIIQREIVEGVLVNNPASLKEDFWMKYVELALDGFETEPIKYLADNSVWFVLLNRIKDAQQLEVDWFQVLIKLSAAVAEYGVKLQGFTTVLEWLITADKNNLLKLLHRSETKTYPASLKEQLYKRLVEVGLLDIKIARRIRSDTSGSLSKEVLSHLFQYRYLYSDDDFQNLIVQFSDTKHKWVARYAALNMPTNLIPFLMGLDDTLTKQILEKRMDCIGE